MGIGGTVTIVDIGARKVGVGAAGGIVVAAGMVTIGVANVIGTGAGVVVNTANGVEAATTKEILIVGVGAIQVFAGAYGSTVANRYA